MFLDHIDKKCNICPYTNQHSFSIPANHVQATQDVIWLITINRMWRSCEPDPLNICSTRWTCKYTHYTHTHVWVAQNYPLIYKIISFLSFHCSSQSRGESEGKKVQITWVISGVLTQMHNVGLTYTKAAFAICCPATWSSQAGSQTFERWHRSQDFYSGHLF